jgi:hypothetical protein
VIELGELKANDFDLGLTGFDDAEITAFLKIESRPLESESTESSLPKADELQQKWQVQEGDLYQCGDHRIWCGSCEDQEGVKRLLTVKPNLMLVATF